MESFLLVKTEVSQLKFINCHFLGDKNESNFIGFYCEGLKHNLVIIFLPRQQPKSVDV